MSEMLERAAQAIGQAVIERNCPAIDRGWVDPPSREDCIAFARAVIESMREPSEPVLHKGIDRRESKEATAAVWRAMIDEILKG